MPSVSIGGGRSNCIHAYAAGGVGNSACLPYAYTADGNVTPWTSVPSMVATGTTSTATWATGADATVGAAPGLQLLRGQRGPFSRAYRNHCAFAVGCNHCATSTTGTAAGGVYNHASATGQPIRRGHGYDLRRRGGSDGRHLPKGSPRNG